MEWFLPFVGTLVIGIMLMFFMMLLVLKTNAMSELKSSMKGTPIIRLYTRDRSVKNVTCNIKAGMAETRNEGRFIITPDSVYRDKKTGVPMLAAFSDYGVTVNPTFPMAASKLKKEGFENITEAEEYNKTLTDDGKQLQVKIPYMETIKFDDLIGFFKYNVSPHYIAASVERRITIALQGVKQIPIGWISAMTVFLVGAAIAYMIITQQMDSGGPQIIQQMMPPGLPLVG